MPVVDKKMNQEISGYWHLRVDYSVTVFPEGEYCSELRDDNNRIFKRNQTKLPGEPTIEKELVQHVMRGVDALRYDANAGKKDDLGRDLAEQWEILPPDINIGILLNSQTDLQKQAIEMSATITRLQHQLTSQVPLEVVPLVPPLGQEVLDVANKVEADLNKLKPGESYSPEVKEASVKMAGDHKTVPEIISVLNDQFGMNPNTQTVHKWLRDAGVSTK